MKRVAIIGGGPAGMSCALWLKKLGLYPYIFEKAHELGGLQNLNKKHNAWMLGLESSTGPEIAKLYQEHIKNEGIAYLLKAEVKSIIRHPNFEFELELEGQEDFVCDALVFATGTRIKRAESFQQIPGFNLLEKHNLISYDPLDGTDLGRFTGHNITVIGAGDNAYQSATLVSSYAKQVNLLVRSVPKAQQINLDSVSKLRKQGKLSVYTHTNIISCEIESEQAIINLESDQGRERLKTNQILSKIGFLANNELALKCFPKIKLDKAGYIIVEPNSMRSSEAFVYAIGDISDPINPCVATAVARGTIAARAIEKDMREILTITRKEILN